MLIRRVSNSGVVAWPNSQHPTSLQFLFYIGSDSMRITIFPLSESGLLYHFLPAAPFLVCINPGIVKASVNSFLEKLYVFPCVCQNKRTLISDNKLCDRGYGNDCDLVTGFVLYLALNVGRKLKSRR